MLAAYLVAYDIPGILSNAREPHVWTLARQIVVQPPREVAVVREADKANDESPDMTHSQMLGKFEYTGGPIFKVVLEC